RVDWPHRSSYEVPLVGNRSGGGGVQRRALDVGANPAAKSKSWSDARANAESRADANSNTATSSSSAGSGPGPAQGWRCTERSGAAAGNTADTGRRTDQARRHQD